MCRTIAFKHFLELSLDIYSVSFLFYLQNGFVKNCGVVVVRGFTSVTTSASNILENSDSLFSKEALKATLVISIAKATFIVSPPSADEPEGFECEKLYYHTTELS